MLKKMIQGYTSGHKKSIIPLKQRLYHNGFSTISTQHLYTNRKPLFFCSKIFFLKIFKNHKKYLNMTIMNIKLKLPFIKTSKQTNKKQSTGGSTILGYCILIINVLAIKRCWCSYSEWFMPQRLAG